MDIAFLLNGETVELTGVSPTTTVLDWLRETRGLTGTKEGCNEGDCGACTVMVTDEAGTRALNGCILFLPQINGKTLTTVEGLAAPDGEMHPVQQAMVEHHGSQCGFCTPGFVVSMAVGQINGETDHDLQLAGNLCRCTGYAPIVRAATNAARRPVPGWLRDIPTGPALRGYVNDFQPTTTAALNQAVVWTTEGPAGRYTKQHLVPFGEYVPLRPIATRISPRVAEIERDMVSGAAPSPLLVDDLALAIALCFDVAYDDVLREQVAQGADLAVVQTSNAMFLGTAQQEQQWTITRARAIELGRSVVVSSMNGISGAIASDGSVIDRLPTARAGATAVSLPVERGTTLAVRLGAWPARIAYALGVAGVLAACWRARRERASGA